MSQSLLYSQNNKLQKNYAASALDNYFQLVRWKSDNGGAVLDVGCGDGSVTIEVLLPRISTTGFKKLVAVDLSEEMIKFAKTQYNKPQVTFQQMNITTEQIPVSFKNAFDHVFSFFCLHWIPNQKKAMENIFKMLVPGGDALLVFVSPAPFYKMYESMSKKPLWKDYMEDFKKYVSSHYVSINAENDLRKILNEQGFNVKMCTSKEIKYEYSKLTEFTNTLMSMNQLYDRIPDILKEKYVKDVLEELEKLNCIKIFDDSATGTFKLFVVCAFKPL